MRVLLWALCWKVRPILECKSCELFGCWRHALGRAAAALHAEPEKTPESGDPACANPARALSPHTFELAQTPLHTCPLQACLGTLHLQSTKAKTVQTVQHKGAGQQLTCAAAPAAAPLLAHEGERDSAAAGQGRLVRAGLHQVAAQVRASRLHRAALGRGTAGIHDIEGVPAHVVRCIRPDLHNWPRLAPHAC